VIAGEDLKDKTITYKDGGKPIFAKVPLAVAGDPGCWITACEFQTQAGAPKTLPNAGVFVVSGQPYYYYD